MLKKLFLYNVGYTYSNLSRLFLRAFTGVMFLHLCVRQLLHVDELAPAAFDGFLGLSPEVSATALLIVESLCAVCIMLGLLMRVALIPPIVIMCIAEWVLLQDPGHAASIFSFQPGYPMMFLGIFVYLLLAGPGKISLDYLIGLHLIDSNEDDEVLDKA